MSDPKPNSRIPFSNRYCSKVPLTSLNNPTKNQVNSQNYAIMHKYQNDCAMIALQEQFVHGKFVHIKDLDGIKIERWEPVDNVFEKGVMGRTE